MEKGVNKTEEFCYIMNSRFESKTTSIYILCLSVWVSVCLYPINVKTAEPIGPNLCVVPHTTPRKISKFQKLASNKIRFSLNFENPRFFWILVFQCIQRENAHNWNWRWCVGAKCPVSLICLTHGHEWLTFKLKLNIKVKTFYSLVFLLRKQKNIKSDKRKSISGLDQAKVKKIKV